VPQLHQESPGEPGGQYAGGRDVPARDELVLRLYARPRFGNVPLAAITQLDVRTWVAELSARGLTPATVTKTYQVFGKVMGAAVDAGCLAQTPCPTFHSRRLSARR
jgi:hypothetical protein